MESVSVLRERRKPFGNLLSQISDVKLPQLAAFLFVFIFSRGSLFGVIRPFPTAFYVSLSLNGASRIISILVITLGNAIYTDFYETVRQLLVLVLFELLSYVVFVTGSKKETINSRAILMSFIVVFSGILRGLVQGLQLYDVVVSLLNSLLVLTLSITLAPAAISFSSKRSINIFDKKTLIAKSIFLSIVIISFSKVLLWNCQLATILAGLAVLIIAGRKGSAMGAMIGAGLGIVVALMDFPGTLQVPGMFALAGAAAGISTKKRRTGGMLWLLAIIVFSALSILDGVLIVKYYESLAAGLIFLIIPNSLAGFLGDELAGIKRAERSEHYDLGITHEAADRLFVLGKSLMRVSRSIDEGLIDSEDEDSSTVRWIIEAVAERVCSRCSMCNRCWNTYLYKTYKMVEDSLSDLKVDERGRVEIPQWFRTVCKNPDKFFDSLSMAHSIYKADKVWRERLNESRMLLSQQSVVISAGIMSLARNMNNLSDRDTETEFRLLCAAESKGVPVSGFRFHHGKESKPFLEVVFEAKNKIDADDLDEIVRENVQNNFIRIGECRRDLMGYSVIKYMKKPRYKTVTGVARVSKDESSVSGDTFAFFIPSSGFHVSAISDGTGSGRQAEKYSRTAIQILESLLEDGIDINLTVRFINLYLNMRGNEDRLATLDICAIDLYNGEASFFKYDASPSVVKKRHETAIIEMDELNDNPNAIGYSHYKSIRMTGGDILIMLSDGVLEAFLAQKDTDNLQQFVEKLDTINPQVMADVILNEAIARSESMHDDMTVLVTKLW